MAIAAYDRELRLERMNDQMAVRTGVEHGAAGRRHVSVMIPPLWPTVRPYYERALDEDWGPASVTVSYRPIMGEGR